MSKRKQGRPAKDEWRNNRPIATILARARCGLPLTDAEIEEARRAIEHYVRGRNRREAVFCIVLAVVALGFVCLGVVASWR